MDKDPNHVFYFIIAMIVVMGIAFIFSALMLLFTRKQMDLMEKVGCGLAMLSSGFIAFSLCFLSDQWVQEGIAMVMTEWINKL